MSEFLRVCLGARGAVLVFFACVLLGGAYFSGIRISFNVSGSLPHRVFLTVRNGEIPCGSGSIGLFRLNVQNPYWDYGAVFAKRFVGCPGDALRTEGSVFYLNGEKIAVASKHDSKGVAVTSFRFNGVIPAGSYFVLGDSEKSYDSRYWGFVKRSWIIGRGFPVALALVLLLAFQSQRAQSSGKHLGVHGKLYEIGEEDMLSYVKRKAGEIDMRALRESMEKKLEESYAKHSLVSLNVPSAERKRVRYVDPSVVVRNPLYDHTGEMISPAGTVNPLDHVSLSKSILVLKEEQLEAALEKIGKRGEKSILILTDGDIRRASSLAGQPVYKANPFILKRLKIEKVPSLVEQEGWKLRIKEMFLE